jgi:RNA polymerase sigma-70 factor (ECF subfamily)
MTSLLSDQELACKAKSDPFYFEEIYQRNFLKIYRYVIARVCNKDLAEDITSEVFLKALSKIDSYHDTGKPFSAWLFRIAHNAYVDYFRKKNKYNIEPLEEGDNIPSKEDVFSQAHQKLLVEKIYQLLEEFSEEERSIILMKIVSDLRFDDIAEILGKNKNTVRTTYFRSLKKLKSKASVLATLILFITV